MLTHALIASRVDVTVSYSRPLPYTSALQSVMNAAARLVVKKRKSDSITPTLRDTLSTLLDRERIDFKLCLLVYKCLHHLAAPYLESMIFPVSAVSTRRHLGLRSASQGDLTVPTTEDQNCWLWPSKFLYRWSITVEHSAVWHEAVIFIYCTVLQPAKDSHVCTQLLRMSAAVIILDY